MTWQGTVIAESYRIVSANSETEAKSIVRKLVSELKPSPKAKVSIRTSLRPIGSTGGKTIGSAQSDKLDLTKTVDASKLQARLFSILREFQRTAPDNFTQVRAWARKKAKENFIMPTNKVALISDHLALFLLGDKNNEFSKQLML